MVSMIPCDRSPFESFENRMKFRWGTGSSTSSILDDALPVSQLRSADFPRFRGSAVDQAIAPSSNAHQIHKRNCQRFVTCDMLFHRM
jgi:hypothetical protein